MIDLDFTLTATAHVGLTLPQLAALAAWSIAGIAWRDFGRTLLQGRRLALRRRQVLLLSPPREVRKLR